MVLSDSSLLQLKLAILHWIMHWHEFCLLHKVERFNKSYLQMCAYNTLQHFQFYMNMTGNL